MESSLMLYGGAIVLGALHAFEPGHGKSIIAAYMIGTRGRAIDGIILGLIVTFTHTFSVIILGILASILSQSFTDDQLHTWMGLFSSILILIVGLWMLKDRLKGAGGHSHFHFFCKEHSHDHHADPHAHAHGAHDHHQHDDQHSHSHDHHADPHAHAHGAHDHHQHDDQHSHSHDHHDHMHHDHDHHDHDHACDHDHHQHEPATSEGVQPENNMWRLLILGVSGGLVPCPPAIVALLAAIAAGRIAEGLTVTLFFSLGLGLVMMTIGVVLSQAGRLTQKISDNLDLARKFGILSAVIITILGLYMLFHSLKSIL